MSSSIFISYDGLMEPLGQSQILRYQEQLAENHKVFILSFEKPEDIDNVEMLSKMKAYVAKKNIIWIPLRYHKKPSALATAYDIFNGFFVAKKLIKDNNIKIVHARSYVPSVIALMLKRILNIKFLFDMRGLWADERVDGGLWPENGLLYRVAKNFERRFLLKADKVISLTQVAIDEIKTFDYLAHKMPCFSKITTCTDLDLFTLPNESELALKPSKPFVLGYVGSVGIWYLFDEAIRVFLTLKSKKPAARFMIFNHGGHDFIRNRLKAFEIPEQDVDILQGSHADVAQGMKSMHAGVFFYTPAYSKKATAPTRLGEFLGTGIPCLINEGVGDMADIVVKNNVGIAINKFDDNTLVAAVDQLIEMTKEPEISTRCRITSENNFSLDEGVLQYNAVYRDLCGE